MKSLIYLLVLEQLFFFFITPGGVAASPITIEITATVRTVSDFDNLLGETVKLGDTIAGTYTYEPATPDANSSQTVADYQHTAVPYGITLSVNGLVFCTDPSDVNFLVEVANNHPAGGGSPTDNYLLRSYNNLFAVSVPTGTFNPTDNHIYWQLDDPTAKALSSDALPTAPPVLSSWQSILGLSISSDSDHGRFFIVADVTSAVLATSTNPDTDNDGMPEDWEVVNGLNPGLNDASLDPDFDGMTNLQEYEAGTNPKDASSTLKLEELRLDPTSALQIRFQAMPNRSYTVEGTASLGGFWSTIENVPVQPVFRIVEVTVQVDGATKFVRVHVE